MIDSVLELHPEIYDIFKADIFGKEEVSNFGHKDTPSVEQIPATNKTQVLKNIASVLQDKGVTVLLAGNMGIGALNVLMNHGIDVYCGNSGDVRKLIEAFL